MNIFLTPRPASKEELTFNEPHPPKENAIAAFNVVVDEIKSAILKSRREWNKHDTRMWERVSKDSKENSKLSDDQLIAFSIEADLVQVRSASTTYGTIILGKIRIPAIKDGFIHVR